MTATNDQFCGVCGRSVCRCEDLPSVDPPRPWRMLGIVIGLAGFALVMCGLGFAIGDIIHGWSSS